jgi:hypothetical protein
VSASSAPELNSTAPESSRRGKMLRGQESLPGKARRASARTNRSRRPVSDPRRISKTRNRDGISSVRRSKTPNQGVCRTQVRPRDGAPESDRLHVLFYVPHSSAPKNSGKRPGRQRKSKLFATWCAIVFDCISMTGAKRRKSREAPGGATRGTGAGGDATSVAVLARIVGTAHSRGDVSGQLQSRGCKVYE